MTPPPDAGASTGSESLNAESDANAPVKGADPQGESAPDGETRAEDQSAPAAAVSSAATDAHEDVASTAGSEVTQTEASVPEASVEVLEVRQGLFGVKGTGDTSGFGGLTRTIEFPPPTQRPFGGWWDQVYDRMGS